MLDTEPLLTIEEVAERLHISVGTARNRISSESADMPPSFRPKHGRRRLFPLSQFNEWVEEQSKKQNPVMQSYEKPNGPGRPKKRLERG